MQISSRLTVAAHALLCIMAYGGTRKVTSEFIAASVNVNPVVIRRVLGALKAAGIVEVARGTGGASLARRPENVTLLDLYRAVDCAGEEGLFHVHERPNPACPVGRNVERVLGNQLSEAQLALERALQDVTLARLYAELSAAMAEERP